MPLTKKCHSCHLVTLLFVFVKATPKCGITNETTEYHVTCTPTDNYNYNLQRGLVSDNNDTTKLTLRACRIGEVDFEAFENLYSLKYLDVSQNKISELKLGVLDGMSELNHLNLSHNLLTGFPLGLFDQMPKLNDLDLSGNKIRTLELGIFDTLVQLNWIDLSNNALNGKDLTPYVFDQSTRITYISYERNNMNGAPANLLHAFEDLRTLNLDRCLLRDVPEFIRASNLKTLRELILSTNQFKKIDDASTLIYLDNLNTLDLSDNIIETIDPNSIKPLKKLKVIILRRNKITTLPDTLFKDMKSLANIDLSHNQIESVPVNAFRGTSLKNLNLASNRFTYLTDNFCLELRNSGAMLTKFYFNQNPWQCGCLRNLLDEVKKFNIAYNGVMYDGKHPICVTTNEVFCKRHDTFNSLYTELYDRLVLGLKIY
ncbi:platelet glycoprotein V [Bicyclus anynana]|uniref:Platelet glycoprotein V n=1 Tax=Bicyclus anynana TaxID=110368 RepID=A0A6J1NA35_BICAN|nr:platelet glycoprotein V [Bicyclus anynana]XP_023939916.2 platelet glycoprotein V [Bicyclus anynana]XP_023939917.2 platelet glycoprotein V [Bicyclus anynana]XP_052743766.1 platelet glycoprotein V [Bicyclus anynana]XP_052743767.1 platelet glycoprotein V [Bicyclus anynana]